MRRRASVALFALVLGTLPAVSPAVAEPEPDFISLNPRGTVAVERDGDHYVWTTDLFSLNTMEKIGSLTDRAVCTTGPQVPCPVLDITTTYRVPGGEITSRGQWSTAPDSTRPGFAFTGSRPGGDTIVSATGRFEDRAGRVTGWGVFDFSQFPARIGVDSRTFIRFDPTDSGVLGRRELILGHEVPGAEVFQAELFSTQGINESDEPGRYLISNPLFSLADGTRIGTAIDSFTCGSGPPPCQVLDGTAELRYPEGTVTAHFEVPFAPDPARPGFYLFGSRPTEDNVVSATGAYAGRTGQLSVSGSVDMRRFPSPIPYEGVGVLVFSN